MDLLFVVHLDGEAHRAVLPRKVLVDGLCPQEFDRSDPFVTVVDTLGGKVEVSLVFFLAGFSGIPGGCRDRETL